jgi:hypothetical protein
MRLTTRRTREHIFDYSKRVKKSPYNCTNVANHCRDKQNEVDPISSGLREIDVTMHLSGKLKRKRPPKESVAEPQLYIWPDV